MSRAAPARTTWLSVAHRPEPPSRRLSAAHLRTCPPAPIPLLFLLGLQDFSSLRAPLLLLLPPLHLLLLIPPVLLQILPPLPPLPPLATLPSMSTATLSPARSRVPASSHRFSPLHHWPDCNWRAPVHRRTGRRYPPGQFPCYCLIRGLLHLNHHRRPGLLPLPCLRLRWHPLWLCPWHPVLLRRSIHGQLCLGSDCPLLLAPNAMVTQLHPRIAPQLPSYYSATAHLSWLRQCSWGVPASRS